MRQYLIAVATSDGATSGVPLTSAGLSGSEGSAASRSHSTRSADCALTCDGLAKHAAAATAIAARAMRRAAAEESAWDRFSMTHMFASRASGDQGPPERNDPPKRRCALADRVRPDVPNTRTVVLTPKAQPPWRRPEPARRASGFPKRAGRGARANSVRGPSGNPWSRYWTG